MILHSLLKSGQNWQQPVCCHLVRFTRNLFLCEYVFILPNLEFVDNTWVLVGVADNSQLGSGERVQEKIEKVKQFAREVQQVPTGVGDDLPEREGELLQQLERERQEAQLIHDAKERAEVINLLPVLHIYL